MKDLFRFLTRKSPPPVKKIGRTPKVNLRRSGRLLYQKKLYDLVRSIEGDIVECGVGEGDSFLDWASLLYLEKPAQSKHLWGFDSFEGFPDPAAEDLKSDGQAPCQRNDGAIPMEVTLFKLKYIGIPEDWIRSHITLIKGYFENSLKNFKNEKISLLHIDADLYQSYLQVLGSLYDKVVPGGVIAFDEYDSAKDRRHWPGARKAVDAFFAERPDAKILKNDDHDKYYLIKPS